MAKTRLAPGDLVTFSYQVVTCFESLAQWKEYMVGSDLMRPRTGPNYKALTLKGEVGVVLEINNRPDDVPTGVRQIRVLTTKGPYWFPETTLKYKDE